MEKTITISIDVEANIQKVWDKWTNPEDVTKWNFASDEWQSPTATNDLKVGGEFHYRMEAKDGSMGFDFWGVYTEVITHKTIKYTLGDDRPVTITFEEKEGKTTLKETFTAENENTLELQKNGWQAILNNFKKHVEKS